MKKNFSYGKVDHRKAWSKRGIVLKNQPKTRLRKKNNKLPAPGSVLVLLSKKYRGKKVVLLKITASGLFIVTGPFLINGVSLRRVNPRYTLPTGATVASLSVSVKTSATSYEN